MAQTTLTIDLDSADKEYFEEFCKSTGLTSRMFALRYKIYIFFMQKHILKFSQLPIIYIINMAFNIPFNKIIFTDRSVPMYYLPHIAIPYNNQMFHFYYIVIKSGIIILP